MRLGFRRVTVLMGVLALVAAGCGEDNPPADGDGSAAAAGVCATYDKSAGDLLAQICTNNEIRVSTDPAYPPQSELNAETGEYEGFDIDVANEIAKRLGRGSARLGDPGLGGTHRGKLERPLGHERRVDDAGRRASEGAELHGAVLVRAGGRGRARTTRP